MARRVAVGSGNESFGYCLLLTALINISAFVTFIFLPPLMHVVTLDPNDSQE